VEAVAVGGFQQQIVRLRNHGWVPDDGRALVAQVAAEDDLDLLAVLSDPDLDDGGAENMPCIKEANPYLIIEGDLLAVGDSGEVSQTVPGVLRSIERVQVLLAATVGLAGLPFGIHLLDVAAVRQHDPAEVDSGLGGQHLAPVALLVEAGNQPRVVDVGVGQQDVVSGQDRGIKALVVARAQLPVALEHAAVHKQLQLSGLQKKTGTGDSAGPS